MKKEYDIRQECVFSPNLCDFYREAILKELENLVEISVAENSTA